MKQEVRDRFSGAVESFTRRNGSSSGLHGDHQPRHRSSENVTPSKDAVSKILKNLTFTFLHIIVVMLLHLTINMGNVTLFRCMVSQIEGGYHEMEAAQKEQSWEAAADQVHLVSLQSGWVQEVVAYQQILLLLLHKGFILNLVLSQNHHLSRVL